LSTTLHTSTPTPRQAEVAIGPSLVMAATALLVIAIAASDPVLSAAIGNLWADATRELMRLVLSVL
jgi:hypothetical protein